MENELNQRKTIGEASPESSQRDALPRNTDARAMLGIKVAISAFFGGWFGFIFAKIFAISVAVTSMAGAVCTGIVISGLDRRTARSIEQEESLIQRTLTHPDFKTRYSRASNRRALAFGAALILVIVGFPLSNKLFPEFHHRSYFDSFLMWSIFSVLAIGLYASVRSYIQLYGARCPYCKIKLKVRGRRPAIAKTYSGLCKQCGVLWDLGVDNNPD
jgi:hypothetical protein